MLEMSDAAQSPKENHDDADGTAFYIVERCLEEQVRSEKGAIKVQDQGIGLMKIWCRHLAHRHKIGRKHYAHTQRLALH